MDGEELWEIQKKIRQPLDAIAAFIVSGDDDLAREVAEGLTHEDLITLVLYLERMYAFSSVEAFRRSGGMDDEDAKKLAAEQFRTGAAIGSLGFGEPPQTPPA